MNTELVQCVTLSEAERTTVQKLMLNAWSAEYALRATSCTYDEEYIKFAMQWTLPQSFHSACFSLRAVLVTLGFPSCQMLTLLASAVALHKYKMYADTNLPQGFFSNLHTQWGTTSHQQPTDIRTEVERLTELVEQINSAHEAHLIDAFGVEGYCQLLADTPQYIRDEFLGARSARLLSRHELLS